MNANQHKFLYKELGYQLRGCFFEIRNNYGPGQKESVYANLIAEWLKKHKISSDKEKSIKIHSIDSGKVMGSYKPDFIIDDKIVLEIKSARATSKQDEKQLYFYLRNSKYEVGYLVNFSTPRLYIKRIIYTNERKPFLKNNLCLSVFLSVLICVMAPLFTRAATLYLEPSKGEYYQGDTFIGEVRLDTQGEEINAGEINLQYPSDLLEVEDISAGNSIFSLWVKTPEISVVSCGEDKVSCGLVSFIGGIPNGFNGDGLIGKIVFKVRKTDLEGESSVPYGTSAKLEFLEGTQVLLNDGKGTKIELTTKGAVFNILKDKPDISKNEWQEELKKDTIPPEPFNIEIAKDPSIFEGKYFIVFNTTDKQTGIDYYEVKEGKRDWKRTTSPYLLEDQSLKSIIKVKAVDKAGNERIAEYIPLNRAFLYWIIIVILIGAGIVVYIIRRYFVRKFHL